MKIYQLFAVNSCCNRAYKCYRSHCMLSFTKKIREQRGISIGVGPDGEQWTCFPCRQCTLGKLAMMHYVRVCFAMQEAFAERIFIFDCCFLPYEDILFCCLRNYSSV